MGYSPFVKKIVFEQIVWIFAQCDCVVFHIAGDEIRTQNTFLLNISNGIRTRKATLEKWHVAVTSYLRRKFIKPT